jgi:hypothetical protein
VGVGRVERVGVLLCGGRVEVCRCGRVEGSEGVDVVGWGERLESLCVRCYRWRDERGKGGWEFGWNEFHG